MNTDLQTFQFHTHQLQLIVDEHGEPWFIAKQVCEILEHPNTSRVVSRLDDDEKLTFTMCISGQNREVLLINESGLYSLILTSRKVEAKAFKKWVTSKVLPSIRKTGGYQAREAFEKLERNLQKANAHLTKLETYWFTKYPHWRIIRDTYYVGYPFSYIARAADKSINSCRYAVKRMTAIGLINPRYAALHRLPHGQYQLWLQANPQLGW